MMNSSMSSKIKVICRQNYLDLFARLKINIIVLVAIGVVEIKNKKKIILFKHKQLIAIMLHSYVLICRLQNVVFYIQIYHLLLKLVQKVISQWSILSQVPSSYAMLIRPSITLSGKIDPLRMSEFVAHKCKITLTSKCKSNKANHFMKSHTSEYSGSLLIEDWHVGVGLSIKEPHGDGFVTNKCLIMTFSIGDTFLFPSSVC